jgi:hypothetical protein
MLKSTLTVCLRGPANSPSCQASSHSIRPQGSNRLHKKAPLAAGPSAFAVLPLGGCTGTTYSKGPPLSCGRLTCPKEKGAAKASAAF